MDSVIAEVFSSVTAMSGWELLAVLLSVAYVWLAARGSLWCWPAAFISTLIFTVLFYGVNLKLESLLQLYYMFMAVYGWWSWRRPNKQTELKVDEWTWQTHIKIWAVLVPATLAMGYWGDTVLNSDFAYWDAFTTVFSVFTTYMVARKILSNWLYWFVIDTVALVLYWQKSLFFTSILMGLYLLFCVYGYLTWKRQYAGRQRDYDLSSDPAG